MSSELPSSHDNSNEPARPDADLREKRVEPLELFFDLVFVFAITQVTARLADDADWGGLFEGLLILAVIWWAWGAYAWLTNEIDTSRQGVRLVFFASMAAMFVAALAIPAALEADAWIFAASYFLVRALHIALFAAGTSHGDVRKAALALAPTAILAPAILIVAAVFDGPAQIALWIAAIGLDYVGGALRGIEGWHLSPSHFAERHGLIIIIALGESIVATGLGAEDVELDLGTVAASCLGIVVVAVLWATYFDHSPERVERMLRDLSGRDRNVTARDAYSFLHLPMVAGIVLLALGLKKTLGHLDDPLKAVPATAICCGIALYFVAQYLYRLRCQDPPGGQRLIAAAVCVLLTPAATLVPAITTLAVLAAICAGLLGYEVTRRRGSGQLTA